MRFDPVRRTKASHDFVTTPHTPQVLHVNRETRNWYLANYLNLGNQYSANGVHFDPELDTLYFRDGEEAHADFAVAETAVDSIPHKKSIKNVAGNVSIFP